jgi:hypothetical protein
MKKNANAQISCRPLETLRMIEDIYPSECWRLVDTFRQRQGADLAEWPSWCFLPMSGLLASQIQFTDQITAIKYLPLFGALASWRATKGIYRFDPETYSAVLNSEIEGNIPCEILYKIPEWCVYIETPDMEFDHLNMYGFWAYLSWDLDGQQELRIVADLDGKYSTFMLLIGKWSLGDAIESTLSQNKRHASLLGKPAPWGVDHKPELVTFLQPVLSLLLYLCSQASEIGDGHRGPKNPSPVKVGKFPRIFEAEKVKIWDVGVRMGTALRHAMQRPTSNEADGGH